MRYRRGMSKPSFSSEPWSYSRLTTLRRCPKLFEYQYIHRRMAMQTDDSLTFGTAVHNALNALYTSGSIPPVLGDTQDDILLRAVLTNYAEHYDMRDQFTVESCEERLVQKLFFGLPDRFLTILDLVVLDERGDRWLVEHKTTSGEIDTDQIRWQSKAFDLQTQLYMRALQTAGRPAKGVVFNLIRRPMIRRKKAETLEEFAHRAALTCSGEEYFQRFHVQHIDDDTLEQRISLLLAQHDACTQAKRWPHNEASCWAFGRECDFAQVCLGRRSLFEHPTKGHK